LPRRLTKQEFIDRTLVRWRQQLPGQARRVSQRDAELVGFVYEQLLEENYRNAFPDASEEERERLEKEALKRALGRED
jgi:lauroyl/myristoyl acyltransferase